MPNTCQWPVPRRLDQGMPAFPGHLRAHEGEQHQDQAAKGRRGEPAHESLPGPGACERHGHQDGQQRPQRRGEQACAQIDRQARRIDDQRNRRRRPEVRSRRQPERQQRIDRTLLGGLDAGPALAVAGDRQVRDDLVEVAGTTEALTFGRAPVAVALIVTRDFFATLTSETYSTTARSKAYQWLQMRSVILGHTCMLC